MKKAFMIFGATGMLLAGCRGTTASGDSASKQPEKSEPYQQYWSSENIKAVDNGYYFIESDKLYFWDKNKKSGTVACSNAGCSHSDERCNAYFGSYGENDQYGYGNLDLEIYGDHFYKMGYEFGDTTDLSVYSISMDGSERKKLFEAYSIEKEGGGYKISYKWKMLDGSYYGVLDSEDDSYGLSRIELDGSSRVVYDMTGKEHAHIDDFTGEGLNLYFTATWEENGDYRNSLVRYDTQKDQAEVVEEDYPGSEARFIDDHTLIYQDVKNNYYKMDLDTKKDELLIEGENSFYRMSTDGVYIYVSTDTGLNVYDLDGKKIDEIAAAEADVKFGDSEYLFIESSYEPETQPTEEQLEADEQPPECMWILDKKQIGSAKKDWMKMELL